MYILQIGPAKGRLFSFIEYPSPVPAFYSAPYFCPPHSRFPFLSAKLPFEDEERILHYPTHFSAPVSLFSHGSSNPRTQGVSNIRFLRAPCLLAVAPNEEWIQQARNHPCAAKGRALDAPYPFLCCKHDIRYGLCTSSLIFNPL